MGITSLKKLFSSSLVLLFEQCDMGENHFFIHISYRSANCTVEIIFWEKRLGLDVFSWSVGSSLFPKDSQVGRKRWGFRLGKMSPIKMLKQKKDTRELWLNKSTLVWFKSHVFLAFVFNTAILWTVCLFSILYILSWLNECYWFFFYAKIRHCN